MLLRTSTIVNISAYSYTYIHTYVRWIARCSSERRQLSVYVCLIHIHTHLRALDRTMFLRTSPIVPKLPSCNVRTKWVKSGSKERVFSKVRLERARFRVLPMLPSCQVELTYADVCWRMLTYADVCCFTAMLPSCQVELLSCKVE